MRNYLPCGEKQILMRTQYINKNEMFFMNMESGTNFEAMRLGLHIVDV